MSLMMRVLALCVLISGLAIVAAEPEGLAELRRLAEQGDVEAQDELGAMYLLGWRGAQKDDAEAVEWYRKAAEQGHADAQFTLAELYGTGRGVQENPVEAVKWLREAAKQGHVLAQNYLAQMFMLRKAADAGSVWALSKFPMFYQRLHEGEFVPSLSNAEGVRWVRKVAEFEFHPGNPHGSLGLTNSEVVDAQRYLCVAYYKGDVVPQDDAEAVKWCRKAAERWDVFAQPMPSWVICTARAEVSRRTMRKP